MCGLIKPFISLLVLCKSATHDIIVSSEKEDICCSVLSTPCSYDVTASRGNWVTVFVSGEHITKAFPNYCSVFLEIQGHSGLLAPRQGQLSMLWHHHPQPRSCCAAKLCATYTVSLVKMIAVKGKAKGDVLCANTWKSRRSRSISIIVACLLFFHRNKRESLKRPLMVILFILRILQRSRVQSVVLQISL